MSTRQKKNRKFTGLVFPVACMVLSAYFANHAINGRLGVNALHAAEMRELNLKFRLAELADEKNFLAHRVSLLKSGNIEKDMLDEQARYHLNLLHENEIVLLRSRLP